MTGSDPNPKQAPPTTSLAQERAHAACVRACSAHDRVADLARQVTEDLDQLTQPGVPVEISEEDSLVTSIETVLDQHQHKLAGT